MIDNKTTLGLELPTDPRWVNLAEMDLGEILTDHAYCEQKAATSCISLIVQYPDKEDIVETLTPIVTQPVMLLRGCKGEHFGGLLRK